MKYIILLAGLVTWACSSEKYSTNAYYSDAERDTLLTNIITYVYNTAPGATHTTKWQAQYRPYYVKNLPSFYIENYFIAPDGWHYYFLIRPVGSSDKRRGVLGKFKLEAGSLKPQQFEEVVNTPHLDEEVLRERGHFLFKKLVEKGNLDEYLAMKQYIEWPDSNLVYNKETKQWAQP